MTNERPPVRVAVIGLDHGHIFGMAHSVVAAGAELVAFHPAEGGLAGIFAKAHPNARAVPDPREILEVVFHTVKAMQ